MSLIGDIIGHLRVRADEPHHRANAQHDITRARRYLAAARNWAERNVYRRKLHEAQQAVKTLEGGRTPLTRHAPVPVGHLHAQRPAEREAGS